MRRASLYGDFSRLPFTPESGQSSVLMQQGRVLLDSDWNAQTELLSHGMDNALRQVIGEHGGPEGEAGFGIEVVTALDFDGRTTFVEVGPDRNFDFSDETPFELEARVWLRPGGTGGTVVSRLLGGTDASGYRLYIRPDGRVVFVRQGLHRGANGPCPALGRRELVSDRALKFGVFTQVVATFDGRDLYLKVGDELVARAAGCGRMPASPAPLLFGAAMSADGPVDFFDGQLLGARIRRLGGDLLGFWPLDDGRGEVAAECVGCHPGQIRGDVRWQLIDLRIGAGSYYAGGVRCELAGPLHFSQQPSYPGAMPPSAPGHYLVYLDVWQRGLSWAQDPGLREVALGGPDTTVRSQTVAQVKCHPLDSPDEAAEKGFLSAPLRPRMQAKWTAAGGLGNNLYRIEVHQPGHLNSEGGSSPTLKWSRRNGSVAFPISQVLHQGSEIVLSPGSSLEGALRRGDWVEILDDRIILLGEPSVLTQVKDIRPGPILVVSPPVGTEPSAPALHPFLRVWNGVKAITDDWLAIEAGIEVRFGANKESCFAPGDFWWIVARILLPQGIEWPLVNGEPTFEPPVGIERIRQPLARLEIGPGGPQVQDRRRIFPPLTRVAGGGEAFPAGLAVLSESPAPPRGWTATGHYVLAPSLQAGWTRQEFPFPEVCWLAGAALGGEVYLASESALWRWNPASPEDEPQIVSRLPEPRREFGLAACRGTLYVVGGFDGRTGELSSRTDQYDPRTGSWCSRMRLPLPRGAFALVELAGKLHALGGKVPGELGRGTSRLHDVYSPGLDGWRSEKELPWPVASAGATLFRDRIFLAGGEGEGEPRAEVAIYRPGVGWQNAPGLPRPLRSPALAVLQGSLWVLGGGDGGAWTSTAATLAPDGRSWMPKPPLTVPPRLPVAIGLGNQLHVFSAQCSNGCGRLVIQTWHGPAMLYVLKKSVKPLQ